MRPLPTYEQSFENLKDEDKWILRCWSEKNKTIPRNIFKFTKKLYIFRCIKCNHEFEQKPHVIACGSFCSYCSHHKLCNEHNCTFCFNFSLASYAVKDKSKYESEELAELAIIESKKRLSCWCEDNVDKDGNKITPRMIAKSTDVKYKFKCYNCHHIFLQSGEGISDDRWCQYCCKPTHMLCDDNNCKHCFDNSFASHPKAIFWSGKNEVTPRDVMKSTPTKKYIFDCISCKNEFLMNTNSISKGAWCPTCRNKTEKKLYEELKEIYPEIKRNFYANWCVNEETNKKLPFDFVIEKYKIIIELDGEQHFSEVKKWNNNVDEGLKRDLYKMKCANDNKYSVIRISQYDVFNDNIEWSTILQESIREIIQRKEVHNYFISYKEDKYTNYM